MCAKSFPDVDSSQVGFPCQTKVQVPPKSVCFIGAAYRNMDEGYIQSINNSKRASSSNSTPAWVRAHEEGSLENTVHRLEATPQVRECFPSASGLNFLQAALLLCASSKQLIWSLYSLQLGFLPSEGDSHLLLLTMAEKNLENLVNFGYFLKLF